MKLKPCPFCGGEASKRLFYKGKYRVHCNVCDAHSGDVCDTEAEAITAWNTRANNHHPYEQRITGNGSDWGEIMRDAYDGLMAAACESCTPEQMKQLFDYIRAELGGGTCEQVLTDYDDGLIPLPTAHCSACGAEWGFTPKYCHDCGAMVTGTRDERKVVER